MKQPALIEFQTAENVPSTDIHQQIEAVYKHQCVDNILWAASVHDGGLEQGFLNLKDKEWSRKPIDEGQWSFTDEVIN
jgi:hypothetical protein